MKAHLACGDVYLRDYVNIDMQGSLGPSPTPTTLDAYYNGRTVGTQGDRWIDLRADVTELPPFEAEELVAVHILEHFPQAQVPSILKHWYEHLEPGGLLFIDIPDVKQSAMLNDEWAMRLIYGSQKDAYSFHKSGFTANTLTKYLEDAGFKEIRAERRVTHAYPTIQILATK
jgi:predicted SAM-dependent methyltransferase